MVVVGFIRSPQALFSCEKMKFDEIDLDWGGFFVVSVISKFGGFGISRSRCFAKFAVVIALFVKKSAFIWFE